MSKYWPIALVFLFGCESTADLVSVSSTEDLATSLLLPNGRLLIGQYLTSQNAKYRLTLQGDGNLLLRNWQTMQTTWASGTNGKRATLFIFQNDGNLVLYTARKKPVWASNTVGSGATLLRLNDNGILALYRESTVVWSVGIDDGSGREDGYDGDGYEELDGGYDGDGYDSEDGYVDGEEDVEYEELDGGEDGYDGYDESGGSDDGTDDDVVDVSTLKNKILAGYQGWFMANGDGAGINWRHWAPQVKPNADNVTVDMWPDMRELLPEELYATDFKYANGTNAGLYSAWNYTTIARHVKWMRDYGIDGVFVQRFVVEAKAIRYVRDRVLNNIRIASETYGRTFANMYDISGANGDTLVADIQNDWTYLVDTQQITQSSRYLRHNGQPVLAIWGFGFSDRPGSATQALELFTWLTQTAPAQYRVTLMGGVAANWRSQSAEWRTAYRKLNIISPWTVGKYRNISGADSYRKNYIDPDLRECQAQSSDYLPVIFPGFSWFNLKDGPFNEIPRIGGQFFWRQAYNAVTAGVSMIYVAMFDEVDESTAIFKIAENASQLPTTGKFVPLDVDGQALRSDFYLRLTGEATKMLRKEIAPTPTIPITQ